MAVYDLEEQEQIDALKAWWRQYGTLVIAGAFALALAAAAFTGWRYWQQTRSIAAAELYLQLRQAEAANDPKRVREVGKIIAERYGSTVYGALGGLAALAWLTVRQNVAYGMEVKNVPRKEREVRLEHILHLVGLADCADLYPNQISASMEQRVSVARAFATHPDLLLMDEPYGQLDVKLRFYLEDELVRLWENLKSTVIFVMHNIEEAVYLAERIIILTNKPTKIKSEIKVDLPRPRDFLNPEFLRIRKEVTELIRWW